jgi:hypothetical protein
MAMENDKIKDLFASKLKDFETDVPASVWGGLDQLLSQPPAPAADPASSSSVGSTTTAATKASLLKTVLITTGVAATVATGVILVSKSEDAITPEENNIVVTENPEPVIQIDTLTEDTPVIFPVKPRLARHIEPEVPVETERKPESPAKEKKPVGEKEPEKPAKKEEVLLASAEKPETIQLPKRSGAKGFSLSASASAGLLSDNITQNGGDIIFSYCQRSMIFINALKTENSEFKLQHRQPVSFGLNINKGLTSNLSVETGLIYTYLSSGITSASMFDIRETQTFHYLGVPLSLNYTFYRLGKMDLYLSAGGMVQKDISGKYESSMGFSKMDIEDRDLAHQLYHGEPYFIRKSIRQSKPQLSTHLKLGTAYPIYNKLYLYGTVGGAYYFDAHNRYRTIFSDRKTQFDLNLGIKFDF